MDVFEPTEDGTRCTICNTIMKTKKCSHLEEHIRSKKHNKNMEIMNCKDAPASPKKEDGSLSQLVKENHPHMYEHENSTAHKSLSN
jgi:hypothetical protein